MRSEEEIRKKIIEVQSVMLPTKEPDRYYAERLSNAVITAFKWVLQEDNQ